MAELLSVGLDVGTSTTQLVFSSLRVENRAGGFAVPELAVTDRKVIYESPVYFTPLLGADRVDGAGIRRIVEAEYEKAGISREQVDTGAVIITGESSRRENARTVLGELSGFAGDFVAATAGPDLESELAARGAGAAEYAEKCQLPVLHMDIGGGTCNLALLRAGQVEATGCLNVGGRLVKYDAGKRITYVSPVLGGLTALQVGDVISQAQAQTLCKMLARAAMMAAGLEPADGLLETLMTREARPWQVPREPLILSFSGGVAACMDQQIPWDRFGDLGPELARAFLEAIPAGQAYVLGKQTIRATVIGAGAHSARLSGSTVFCRGVELPLSNLPVAVLSEQAQFEPDAIATAINSRDGEPVVLALPGVNDGGYERIRQMAQALWQGAGDRPLLICLEQDMAKALGQCLSLLRGPETACMCIDRLRFGADSYLDVGKPIGPAMPVVIKTLVLGNERKTR